MSADYQPQDRMSLWWLGEPAAPRLVGALLLADSARKVALEYAPGWLARGAGGFALSEDLPLQTGLFLPPERDMAAGAVDDARPDRWGERVIRLIDRPARLSLLEYLYFAGDDRAGALGVSLDPQAYRPRERGGVPVFAGLEQMHEAVRRVLAGDKVPEAQARLLRPGASFGGMRPKSLMQMDGQQWVVKFADSTEMDAPLVEHAAMRLAQRCGIRVAETRALPVAGGHAVAVRRFDRMDGRRLHVLSAHVALRAAGEEMGYPELAQLLRRLGRSAQIKAEQEELFRRMVFNFLIDNTDDHEKNHALVRGEDGHHELSEAYDIVPSAQGLGYQQLRVGHAATESTLDNALSECKAFGLGRDAAAVIVRDICRVVDGWRDFFRAQGVTQRDLEMLAQYIDGPRLAGQRTAA
ncbi:MAG: type II toxin-antitoxin system HipA family toxin [Chloroflexota bacterium]|nr:type II toxin-antitoxin system HipA family toxin [Chloroflexota bacterium]